MKIKKGSKCHYCSKEATTRDHIVPKSRVEGNYNPKVTNFVPCCTPCNLKKADYRSDCDCDICMKAWLTYGPLEEIPIINLLWAPGATSLI